jgi:hypothetical protein
MSRRARILRYLLIALGLLLFAGYFLFSTLFFNPLEGDLEVDVAALAPRDVDVYVARADLNGAFDGFPRLAVQDQLDQNPGWRAWIASPEYAELVREHQIEQHLAELAALSSQLPLGLEPQQVFGGRDLALVAYVRGPGVETADWAAYGRANWLGKLAVSALFHPGWFGLAERGLTVVVDERIVSIEGAGLPRKLWLTRVRDVVVVATRPELAKAAHDLEGQAYADSLYQSAMYFDHVHRAPDRSSERDEIEVVADVRKLSELLGVPEPWPDTRAQDFAPAFLGRLFQLSSFKNVAGVLQLRAGLSADLHGELASERTTPDQQRIYRARGFSRDDLLGQAAAMAPADTGLFVYLHAGIGDLLRLARDASEPALRGNLEDVFRNTGKYPKLDVLIDQLDGALKDRAALIVRPNDYPPDPGGPRHDGTPVPAWAVVLWPKKPEVIVELRETIGQNGSKFGLEGRQPGEPGYFSNTDAGFEIREFWSPLVPGTGMIATCNANDLTIVTNSFRMLGHILKTSTQGGERYPRLSEDPTFQALVRSSFTNGNFFVWANPRSIAPILRASAERRASDSIAIDWKAERRRLEDKALRERFAGKRRPLSAEDQAALDRVVDPELEALEARVRAEQVPALVAREERWLTYAEQIRAAALLLALDPKSFDLSLRVLAPLAEE